MDLSLVSLRFHCDYKEFREGESSILCHGQDSMHRTLSLVHDQVTCYNKDDLLGNHCQ